MDSVEAYSAIDMAEEKEKEKAKERQEFLYYKTHYAKDIQKDNEYRTRTEWGYAFFYNFRQSNMIVDFEALFASFINYYFVDETTTRRSSLVVGGGGIPTSTTTTTTTTTMAPQPVDIYDMNLVTLNRVQDIHHKPKRPGISPEEELFCNEFDGDEDAEREEDENKLAIDNNDDVGLAEVGNDDD